MYCLLLLSVSALFSTNILVDNVKADWWNNSWDHYRTITLDHTKIDSDLSNFPVLVIFDNSSYHIDNSNSIRFLAGSNSGGTENSTEYNFEIEKWDNSGNCYIWVNVTEVYSASDTVFNMYYNNSAAVDGQDVAGTWNSNYLTVYHLSESSGTVYDSTSNDNDGTNTGAGYGSTGVSYHCFDFENDNNDRVRVYPDSGLRETVTVEVWVKPESIGTEFWYCRDDASPDDVYSFGQIHSSVTGKVYYDCYAGASNSAVGSAINPLTVGNWFCLASTFDDESFVKMYVDGVNTGTDSSVGTFIDHLSVQDQHYLGSRYYSSAYNSFDGLMDEFRLSNVCRNDSWLKACYHSQNQTTGFLTFGAEQDKPTSATVPVVTTNDATGVEENNATIRGTLTNNGTVDTTCYFIWGDETPPTDHNDSQGVIAHQASFSKDCTSISEGTLYYFYTKASNSEGWDVEGVGGIKSFLTKPDPPSGASASSSSSGSSWINLSWTAGAGADRYYVRYSDTATPTTRSEGTELCNVTTTYYNSTFSTSGTYYFSVWSYASESSPALHQWSDTYNSASEYLSIHTWHSESFGGKLTVTLAIDVELNDSSWIAGSLDCGDDVQKNFTFYQNGSATIDISIGINSTNGNYSFVNYTTWSNSGHDQYCANFTVDTWSSESMIEPGYPASSVLKSSFAPGNFVYGIRLWMPKSVTYQDRQEDFEVVLHVSEST